MLRPIILCIAITLAACAAPSTSDDGRTQLQRQTQFRIEQLLIRDADVTALSLADMATINDIARERTSLGERRARVLHILREAGAV